MAQRFSDMPAAHGARNEANPGMFLPAARAVGTLRRYPPQHESPSPETCSFRARTACLQWLLDADRRGVFKSLHGIAARPSGAVVSLMGLRVVSSSFPGRIMTIDWTPLADLIETHDRFLVTTHVRPDGDALGSEVGMAGLLRQKGKHVRVVNASHTPPRYDFLDPEGRLFEHFGTKVQAGRARGPRGGDHPRPLGLEPARRDGRVHPRLSRALAW